MWALAVAIVVAGAYIHAFDSLIAEAFWKDVKRSQSRFSDEAAVTENFHLRRFSSGAEDEIGSHKNLGGYIIGSRFGFDL